MFWNETQQEKVEKAEEFDDTRKTTRESNKICNTFIGDLTNGRHSTAVHERFDDATRNAMECRSDMGKDGKGIPEDKLIRRGITSWKVVDSPVKSDPLFVVIKFINIIEIFSFNGGELSMWDKATGVEIVIQCE